MTDNCIRITPHSESFMLKYINIILLVVLVNVFVIPLRAANPFLPDSAYINAQWLGLYVADLNTGKVVVEHNADRLFVPASLTKLMTTASVVMLCDTNSRFITKVDICGNIMQDTILNGDIIIRSSGDPVLGYRSLPEAAAFIDNTAKAIKDAGIRQITGKIIVDKSAVHDSGIPEGWKDNDLVEPYGAPYLTFNFKGNVVTRTETVVKGKGKKAKKTKVSKQYVDTRPDTTVVAYLTRALKNEGIAVLRESGLQNGKVKTLYEHESPRYIDIMTYLMKYSDNLVAEGMLRSIVGGRSRQEALDKEYSNYKNIKAYFPDSLVKKDGSGLSRLNRITPKTFASVLAYMAKGKNASSYARMFPLVGLQGTVKGFLKGTDLEGRLALKTGSLNDVQCYAGYAFADETKPNTPTHVVVCIANFYPMSRAELKQALAKFLMYLFSKDSAKDAS